MIYMTNQATPNFPLVQGDVVMVEGYEFEVIRTWVFQAPLGPIWRFEGKVTSSQTNDRIRHTAYAHGEYSCAYEGCKVPPWLAGAY